MQVRHKVTGRIYTVAEDYFKRNVDTLEVLEVVPADKPKRAPKKTKVITDTTEVSVGES